MLLGASPSSARRFDKQAMVEKHEQVCREAMSSPRAGFPRPEHNEDVA